MKTNISMQITPNQLSNGWITYVLWDKSANKIQYVGVCRMSQIGTIPDARANAFFNEKFPKDETMILMVTNISESKHEALNEKSLIIRQHGMPEMILNHTLHKGVQCVETGEIFSNMSQAAEAHGISQGNLSRHLRGLAGYASVGGKHYIKK